MIDKYRDLAMLIGFKAVEIVLILLVGIVLIKFIKRLVNKIAERNHCDKTVTKFLSNILIFFLKVMLVIVIISQIGINVVSISAAIGGSFLAIGLALQGALSNFAMGLIIMVFKPFRVGDYIEFKDYSGTVEDIEILSTVLRTASNTKLVIPHSQIMSGPINNYGKYDLQVIVEFLTSIEADIDRVIENITNLVDENDILAYKGKSCVFVEQKSDSLKFKLKFWVKNENYWAMISKYKRLVVNKLTELNINRPKSYVEVSKNE